VEAEGHRHLAGGTGVGANKCLTFRCGGPGFAIPPIFFVYFKYKIPHSNAFFGSENGHYECFYQEPYALGGGNEY